MTPPHRTEPTIEQIIRRESTRLTAALVGQLGTEQLALAEDVAQDAMLAALSTWHAEALPSNPSAWLRRVAKNRAIDILRRKGKETDIDFLTESVPQLQVDADDSIHSVEDAELRLLYLSCHPSLSPQDQVVLCLHLATGFTANDISKLLLKPRSTVAQRLVRLKQRLRNENALTSLSNAAIADRTGTVLRALYLMFCAGYLPASGDRLMRDDIVFQSLRLAGLVANNDRHLDEGMRADASALCALFCLQSSRQSARERDGRLIVLAEQDRTLWDRELIQQAMAYLAASQKTENISRYHIEAAIALEHASAASFAETNWDRIALLYEQLEIGTQSSVVSISAALATLYQGRSELALAKLCALQDEPSMQHYPPYYAALAEVLKATNSKDQARAALRRARDLQDNQVLRDFLDVRYALDDDIVAI